MAVVNFSVKRGENLSGFKMNKDDIIYQTKNGAGEIMVVPGGKNIIRSLDFLSLQGYKVAHSGEVLKVEEAGVIDHRNNLAGLVAENFLYVPNMGSALSKDGILFSSQCLQTVSADLGFKNYVPLPEVEVSDFIKSGMTQGKVLNVPKGRVSLSADRVLSNFLLGGPLNTNSSRSLDASIEAPYTSSASFIFYDKKRGGDFVVGPMGSPPIIGYRPLQ